jgi:NIPSNAP
MVFEERTYTIKPGQVAALLVIYEREGLPAQRRHLGDPVGWFTSEFGPLNQVVHIWRFESLDDRAKRRAALFADAEWLAFVPKALQLIEKQENRILVPTSFSPLR